MAGANGGSGRGSGPTGGGRDSDRSNGAGPSGSGPDRADDSPDVFAAAQAIGKEFAAVGAQFKAVFDQVAEDAQFHFDKEMARALAKHPELYAEIRKTLRQIKKTADKAAEALGIDEK